MSSSVVPPQQLVGPHMKSERVVIHNIIVKSAQTTRTLTPVSGAIQQPGVHAVKRVEVVV